MAFVLMAPLRLVLRTQPRSFGWAATGGFVLFLNRINQLAHRIVLDTVMRSDYGDHRVEQQVSASFQTEMTRGLT